MRVTSASAQDPGNPYPALLAGLAPAPAPQPVADPADHAAQAPAGPPAEPAPLPHQQPASPEPASGPAAEHGEHTAVRIDMLGTLRITGGAGSTHAHTTRTTTLATLIHLRPGRSATDLCTAMDPLNPWQARTLHTRLAELRGELGLTKDGHPLLPRPKAGDGYRYHPQVTSDWDQFRRLASRGLSAGPKTGIADLENAMALVRGKPFDGRNPPWAEPVAQEMLSRITDTAHTLAHWHTDGDTPDLDAARRTVLHALDIEETSEVLYRDLLHIERAAHNTLAVRRTVTRLQHMARTYDIPLDNLTEDTINHVLTNHPTPTS